MHAWIFPSVPWEQEGKPYFRSQNWSQEADLVLECDLVNCVTPLDSWLRPELQGVVRGGPAWMSTLGFILPFQSPQPRPWCTSPPPRTTEQISCCGPGYRALMLKAPSLSEAEWGH